MAILLNGTYPLRDMTNVEIEGATLMLWKYCDDDVPISYIEDMLVYSNKRLECTEHVFITIGKEEFTVDKLYCCDGNTENLFAEVTHYFSGEIFQIRF